MFGLQAENKSPGRHLKGIQISFAASNTYTTGTKRMIIQYCIMEFLQCNTVDCIPLKQAMRVYFTRSIKLFIKSIMIQGINTNRLRVKRRLRIDNIGIAL